MLGFFTIFFGKNKRQCPKDQSSIPRDNNKPKSAQKEQVLRKNTGSQKYLVPQISKHRDYQRESVQKEKQGLKTRSSSISSDQSDDQTLYFQHCETLNIDPLDGMNIQEVKKQFKTKITLNTQFKRVSTPETASVVKQKKQKRILILLAYHYLTCKIFDTSYSPEQSMFIVAIFSNDVQKVTQMINQSKELVGFKTKGKGYSALYLAAMSGHAEMVETIIRRGYKFSYEKNQNTPAHIAAWCGHYHVTKLLLSYFVPHNLPNQYGNLLIDEASNSNIEELLEQADKDPFNKLMCNLVQQSLLVKVVNIVQNGQVIIRKIILRNHYKSHGNRYVTAFHGTKMQNLLSIAKYGMKKPGAKVGESITIVSSDSIQPNIKFNGDQNWANNIFASPSIHYANKYSHPQYYYSQKSRVPKSWKPIVQLKVKKDGFETFGDTTGGHQRVGNEPEDLEYKIADEGNVDVVALLMVKRGWLGEFRKEKQPDYRSTSRLIMES